jgi:hypothetical protein
MGPLVLYSSFLTNVFGGIEAESRQEKYILTELNEKNKFLISVQFRRDPMKTGSVNKFSLLSEKQSPNETCR